MTTSRANIFKHRSHFDNADVGLMLRYVDKGRLTEEEESRAKSLLKVVDEIAFRESATFTLLLTAFLVFGVAGWSVYEGVALSRDWSSYWKVPFLALSAILGGFGGLILTQVILIIPGLKYAIR